MLPPHAHPAYDHQPQAEPSSFRPYVYDGYAQTEQCLSIDGAAAYVYRSSSSTLAHALDPNAANRRRPGGQVYPKDEFLPTHYSGFDSVKTEQNSPHSLDVDVSANGPYNDVAGYSGQEYYTLETPYHPTSGAYATATTASQGYTGVEHGSFQGRQVMTALHGLPPTSTEYGSSTSHGQQTFQGAINDAPSVMQSSRPHFQPVRSYTLAEAMTPVEDRKQVRSPKVSQAPPPAADAKREPSLPASTPTLPQNPSSPYPVSSATATASPTPPPPVLSPSPFSKFHAASPFQIAPNASSPIPYSPQSQFSYDDMSASDAEGRPTEQIIELAVTMPQEPAKKKPTMACLFCRERKIGCGPPSPDSVDKRCRQCIKRDFKECTFPKESRRGQHKRTPRAAARIHALTSGERLSPPNEAMASLLTSSSKASRSKSKTSVKREKRELSAPWDTHTPRRMSVDVTSPQDSSAGAGPSSASF